MIRSGEKLPFDVGPNRTIVFDFDVREARKAEAELERMIQNVETDPTTFETPLSFAVNLAPLDNSRDPVELGITKILALVQDMRTIVGDLQSTDIGLENRNLRDLITTVPIRSGRNTA